MKGDAKMRLIITRFTPFTAALVLIGLFTNCSTGQLTKEKAESALYEWKKVVEPLSRNTGSTSSVSTAASASPKLVVEGIHELPLENSARVSFKLNDFEFGGEKLTYSGSGTATFARYNDGRWVLTRVETSERVWEGDKVKNGGSEIVVK